MQETTRAQKINVSKSSEEEEPFDCRRKTNQVQQELAAMFIGFQCVEFLDGIHPFHAELSFLADRGNVFHSGKSGGAFFRIRDVGIEQCEIELDMYGFFKQLPR